MPFFHFLSVARKKTETKERAENVLSSEAGCPIFVIIQRTRYAQTAFHVDFLVSLRDTRIEEDSENSTSSKDLLVRNVFNFGCALAIVSFGRKHSAQGGIYRNVNPLNHY
jgi:hypothetical protein